MNHFSPNLFHICRTCTVASAIVYPIFGSFNIDKILSTSFQIIVTENDSLPQVICESCFRTIINTAMIQQKFKAAESHLRARLTQVPVIEENDMTAIVKEEEQIVEIVSTNDVPIVIAEKTETPDSSTNLRKGKTTKEKTKHDCKSCGMEFSNKLLYMKHTRMNHAVSEIYKCELCKVEFNTKQKFRLHKSTIHWDHYPFECKYCKSMFKQSTILKRHILRHHY